MHNFWVNEFLKQALFEDIGRGDLFSNIAKPKPITGKIIAKESGVLSGEVFALGFNKLFPTLNITMARHDKDTLTKGDVIATLAGDSNVILMVERVLLNTLQHSSGIASKVARFKSHITDPNLALLDTRKTRPLLREFEKYSSRNGGATNHRMGLDDCLMLKDTHLRAIEDLASFVKEARKQIPWTSKIEIECESYDDAARAIDLGVEVIMCDNMNIDEIKKVVSYRNTKNPKVLIEASGNITEHNVANYEFIGLDAISSGSLIHQATWLDFSLKID